MIEAPPREMILRGEIPNGAKVIIEPNDVSYENMVEDESVVNIKIVQSTEVVPAEQ